MSHRGSDAESKFWEMSELFERLLIDASSVINLVESHARTRELIQRPFVWNKVFKNIVPDNEYVYDWESEEEEEVEKEGMLGSVWNLSRLSDIFEDPTPFQPDLLHLICERNPPNRKSDSLGYHLVELVCCCNQVHVVSPLGFLLLEEVEESWGSTKQIVDKVQLCNVFSELESRSPALTQRVVRQQRMVSVVNTQIISCNSKTEAEAFYALTENCQALSFRTLEIALQIGADGWAAIRKAIELVETRYDLMSKKKAMVGGNKEDMRAIWNSLGPWSSWWVMPPGRGDYTMLENWEMLEGILDTRDEEDPDEEEDSG